MTENILVCTAWPYANGDLHIGHLAGAYLPPDIFARYHRLKGNTVLMVSGSDSHGTPITIRADAEGVTPLEVFERFHLRFLETFQKPNTAITHIKAMVSFFFIAYNVLRLRTAARL